MYSIKHESTPLKKSNGLLRLVSYSLLLIALLIALFILFSIGLFLDGRLTFDTPEQVMMFFLVSTAYLCWRFGGQLLRICLGQEPFSPASKYSGILLAIGVLVWGVSTLIMLAVTLKSFQLHNTAAVLCTGATALFASATYQNIRRWRRLRGERRAAALAEQQQAEVNITRLSLRFAGSLLYSLAVFWLLAVFHNGWQKDLLQRSAADGALGLAFLGLAVLAAVSAWKSWQHFLKMFQRYADKQKKW